MVIDSGLREKIAFIVASAINDRVAIGNKSAHKIAAAAILAIPEIKEALANRSTAKHAYGRGYEDGLDIRPLG